MNVNRALGQTVRGHFRRSLSGPLVGLLLAGVFHAACSSPPMLEPNYEACASDENWRTFDDYETTNRVVSDPTNTPQWLMPAMGASEPAATPVIFQWQPTPQNAGMPDGDVTCPQFQPSSLPLGVPLNSDSLTPMHLPPVSGTVYDLHMAINGSDAYRVVTTRQRAAAPVSSWSTWGGQTLTVTLFRAEMLMNEIVMGPYEAGTLTIQVTP